MLAARASRDPADPADLELHAPGPALAPAVGATLTRPDAATAVRRWPPKRGPRWREWRRPPGRPVALTGGGDERVLAGVIAALGLPPRWCSPGEPI